MFQININIKIRSRPIVIVKLGLNFIQNDFFYEYVSLLLENRFKFRINCDKCMIFAFTELDNHYSCLSELN